ncbi:MAG: hypothetical protein ACRDRE_11675 [Pseudonocardiaceae bacterium]
MITNAPSRDLAKLLGAEAAAALTKFAELRNRTVDFAEPRWVANGKTGAVLAAVVLRAKEKETAHAKPQKFIVKVCPPGEYSREPTKHQEALDHSPPNFAKSHFVELASDPIQLGSGGVILNLDIAGGSLLRCRPMFELTGTDHNRAAHAVAQAILNEWNPKFGLPNATVAQDERQRRSIDQVR